MRPGSSSPSYSENLQSLRQEEVGDVGIHQRHSGFSSRVADQPQFAAFSSTPPSHSHIGTRNPLQDQLELAAAVFTKARKDLGVLELTAVVDSDPPVEFTLVDLAGKPVDTVQVHRLANQDNADKLPSSISVYGLHPERAEPLQFFQDQRELIATVSAKWSAEPVRVVLRPTATLTGRFVDKAGQPSFDFGIRILGPVVMPDTFVAGRRLNITDKPGERSGEFRQVLTPGFDVRGEFVRYNFDSLERVIDRKSVV